MTPRRSRRSRHDRGAIIVEAALILPFFTAFVFGIAEYGLMAHTATELNWSARTATLDLARGYADEQIDADVLRNVALEYSGAERAEILGVMVFRARPNGTPAPACTTALTSVDPTSTAASGVTDRCNVYSGAVVAAVASGVGAPVFGADCTGADRFFCPTAREPLFNGTNAIGVQILVSYSSMTGLLPFLSTTLTERAVMLPIR